MTNEERIFNFMERSSKFLEIAKYQRNYSWGQKNLEELWIDVMKMTDKNAKKHFLNTVIIYPKDQNIEEVVDGQQRIITFAILCIALRNHCLSNNIENTKNITDRIEQMLIDNTIDDVKQCRFTLKDCDKQVFMDILENKQSNELSPKTKSHLIYKAYNFFKRQINASTSPNEIFKALMKFNINVLKCDSSEEASTTFARINSTGLNMKEHEQINAFVYQRILSSHLEEHEQADLTEKWLSITENSEYPIEFLLFCYGYANNMFDGRIKKNQYSKAILETLNKNNTSIYEIVDSVYDIYQFWLKPTNNKKIQNFIYLTSAINIPTKDKNKNASYAMPMLIIDVLYKKYDGTRKINDEDALRILKMGNDIIIKRRICKNSLDGMFIFNSPMAKASARWLNGEGNIADLFYSAVMNSHIGLDLSASIPTITTQLENGISPSLSMFILQNINAHYSDNNVCRDGVTLEHIIPKKYKDEYEGLNRLGNLTLLQASDNSSVKDCDYEKKKDTYLKSGYAINEWFKDVDIFDEDSIEERTQLLIKQFYEVFPMFTKNDTLADVA